MAIERNPNDFDRDDSQRDIGMTNSTDDLRRRARLDSELQADPELAEGTASGGRIGMFAIAVVAILGVVFYGLNNSNTGTTTPTNTATQTAPQNNNSTMSVPPAGQSPAQQQAVNPPAGQTTGSATTPSQAPASNDPAPTASTPQAAPAGQDAPRANDAAPAREPSN